MTQTRLILTIGTTIGLLAAYWSMTITTEPFISTMVGLVTLATAVALLSPRGRSPASRRG